ncbi:hypothetical protein [Nostoc sp. ChiQUE01b]|nr:hypothetical protein [Nostoc sp. ChiQUE01b]MDZ8264138.1 hypothetical protein [Nostoc sp. ChiQUE01b]
MLIFDFCLLGDRFGRRVAHHLRPSLGITLEISDADSVALATQERHSPS